MDDLSNEPPLDEENDDPVSEGRTGIIITPNLDWKVIADGAMTTDTLLRNLSAASYCLKELKLENRSDVNIVLNKVARSCIHLESLIVIRSGGSTQSSTINNGELCKVARRCSKLRFLKFLGCKKINSTRFFEILANRRETGADTLKGMFYGRLFTRHKNMLLNANWAVREDRTSL